MFLILPKLRRLDLFIYGLGLLLLASCASRPTEPVIPEEQPLFQGIGQQTEGRSIAQEQAIEEQKLRAAEQALEEASEEEDLVRIEQVLGAINVAILNDRQRLRRQIAIIRFYLLRESPGIARRYINAVNDDFLVGIERDLQRNWFLAYADVLEAGGDPLSALRMRLLLDERLTAQESAANHPDVFRLLGKMKMEDLFIEAQLAPDLYMRGWYDFAMLSHLDPYSARSEPNRHWQAAYPRHPGGRYFNQLAVHHRGLPPLRYFNKVAFLLPFSGNLAEISESIYNGYEVMAKDNLIPWQPLRLDTNEESIPFLLAQAKAQGAELIIGPLRKENVEEAALLAAQLAVPIITLNELPSVEQREANLYSITLSLEQSAQFAVDMAWDNSCRWSLLLVDETELGLRIAQEIQAGWEEKGGILVKTSLLDGRESISPQIAQFLEVDAVEVAATKEVYRQYLLILGRLGWTGEEIDDVLAGNKEIKRVPYVLARENKELLLKDEEIVWLQDKYYEKNFLIEGNLSFLAELVNDEERNFSLANAEYYSQYSPEELLEIFKSEMEKTYERVEADCIFLAMERAIATQARPYFSFYLANDMDVYGTFLLLDAGLTSATYEDLNQVGYGEMPWMSDLIRDPEARDSAASSSVYDLKYHALGRDVFLIAQSLNRLNAAGRDSPLFILGHSGILQLQEDGVLASRPRRVVFLSGLPRPFIKRSIFE